MSNDDHDRSSQYGAAQVKQLEPIVEEEHGENEVDRSLNQKSFNKKESGGYSIPLDEETEQALEKNKITANELQKEDEELVRQLDIENLE